MRCTECNMPLSPQRTSCPRCGAPTSKDTVGKTRLPHPVPRSFPPYPTPPQENSPASQGAGVQPMLNAPIESIATMQQPIQSQLDPNQAPGMPPRIKLGFTVAGVCFASGTLLLILVAILAQSLPSSTTNTQLTPPVKTSMANHGTSTTPIVTATPHANTPVAATPTPTLSAANYIDNVHLASSVNASTGAPLAESSSFHIGQQVYITMTLNEPAYNGAVCLNWSVNNNGSIPYNMVIGNSGLAQTNAYFYFKPGSAGQGQVDVYWSRSTACVNKMLVQKETFTVLP